MMRAQISDAEKASAHPTNAEVIARLEHSHDRVPAAGGDDHVRQIVRAEIATIRQSFGVPSA